METHVARDENGKLLRWCSQCRNYQAFAFLGIVARHVRHVCTQCGKKAGTSRVIKYE